MDFVVRRNRKLTAIKIKSGLRRDCLPGMSAFVEAYQPTRCLLVGGDGIPLDDFLRKPATFWFQESGFERPVLAGVGLEWECKFPVFPPCGMDPWFDNRLR